MQQPTLPQMPPMQPAAKPQPSPAPSSPPPSAVSASGASSMGRRLRQMLGYAAGGSMALILAIGVGEMALKPGLRPADLLATVESHVELGIMNQRMGHKPGEHVLTEAQYREAIVKAERNGQARAELAYQKDLAVVQADKERVVGAYTTLYQRANMIASAAIQMEQLAQQFRQQLLAMAGGGRSVVIGVKDLFCGLGDQNACQSAHQDRVTMIEEADELSGGHVAARVRELMSDIDDPATLIAREDQRRNDVPSIAR